MFIFNHDYILLFILTKLKKEEQYNSFQSIIFVCFSKLFFLFLKSGRRPLKWWRSVQIPCWYEKAIFCFTETKTNYRYFKILSRKDYNCYHWYIVLFVIVYSFFSLIWHMSFCAQCWSVFSLFYSYVV